MRATYRKHNNKDYWTQRWSSIQIDDPIANLDVYPAKYAEMVVDSKTQKILEAGCGTGRLLRYYHNLGYDIQGFDFVENAVERLKKADSSLRVQTGEITNLNYPDASFDCVLAFGLYHNLEGKSLKKSIAETHRVMTKGGKLCASFRADNIQNYLNDLLANGGSLKKEATDLAFHKLNLKASEMRKLFEQEGFRTLNLLPVVNMPLLYKFKYFRHPQHRNFNETLGRKEGYKLSMTGKIIQNGLIKLLPQQFCNVYVLIGEKK